MMMPDVSRAPQVFLCQNIPNLKPQATDRSLQTESLKLSFSFFLKAQVRRKKIIISLLILFAEDEQRYTPNSHLISWNGQMHFSTFFHS